MRRRCSSARRVAADGGGRLAQFRGSNCSGISTSSLPLPTTFSDTENVRWSVPLGDGIGSPAVAAGRVFVSAMVDDQTIALDAFDAASGKQLWQRTWPTGAIAEVHHTNSHASTTPAADAERRYFYSSTLGLLCCDAATALIAGMPTCRCHTSYSSGDRMSPVLHGDYVVILPGRRSFAGDLCLRQRTGQLRWKDDRHDMWPVIRTRCSTPVHRAMKWWWPAPEC